MRENDKEYKAFVTDRLGKYLARSEPLAPEELQAVNLTEVEYYGGYSFSSRVRQASQETGVTKERIIDIVRDFIVWELKTYHDIQNADKLPKAS